MSVGLQRKRIYLNLFLIANGIVISLVSLFLVNRIAKSVTTMGEFHGPSLHAIEEIHGDTANAIQEGFAYVVSGEAVEKEEFYEWHSKFDEQLDAFRRVANAGTSNPDASQRIDSISTSQDRLVQIAERLFNGYERKGKVDLADFHDFEHEVDNLLSHMERLIDIQNEKLDTSQQAASMALNQASFTLFSIVIGSALLVIGTVWQCLQITRALEAREKAILEAAVKEQERKQVSGELALVKRKLINRTRLATIGQVSASIAHELRNPLGSIRNAAFVLKRRTAEVEDARQFLDIIDQDVERADRIIADLMGMARAKTPQPKEFDLSELVHEVFDRTKPDKDAKLILDVQPNPFFLFGDAELLQQVFRNLFTNSFDAVRRKQAVIHVVARTEEDGFQLEVRDNGSGVGDNEDIFEPLYSTKAKGTGLGLTICRQIIENHGGTIALDRSEMDGTRFLIYLPLRQPSQQQNLEYQDVV